MYVGFISFPFIIFPFLADRRALCYSVASVIVCL